MNITLYIFFDYMYCTIKSSVNIVLIVNQLARRVREMREARAAPAVQSRARKSSNASALPRKSMTASESLPRGGNELVDPLGIG